jgi:hypothetical protein
MSNLRELVVDFEERSASWRNETDLDAKICKAVAAAWDSAAEDLRAALDAQPPTLLGVCDTTRHLMHPYGPCCENWRAAAPVEPPAVVLEESDLDEPNEQFVKRTGITPAAPAVDVESLMNLTMSADSLLSYMHHRGYIAYDKHGAPQRNEVETMIGNLRKVSRDWLAAKGGKE